MAKGKVLEFKRRTASPFQKILETVQPIDLAKGTKSQVHR